MKASKSVKATRKGRKQSPILSAKGMPLTPYKSSRRGLVYFRVLKVPPSVRTWDRLVKNFTKKQGAEVMIRAIAELIVNALRQFLNDNSDEMTKKALAELLDQGNFEPTKGDFNVLIAKYCEELINENYERISAEAHDKFIERTICLLLKYATGHSGKASQDKKRPQGDITGLTGEIGQSFGPYSLN